jgi:hypothetical protein
VVDPGRLWRIYGSLIVDNEATAFEGVGCNLELLQKTKRRYECNNFRCHSMDANAFVPERFCKAAYFA